MGDALAVYQGPASDSLTFSGSSVLSYGSIFAVLSTAANGTITANFDADAPAFAVAELLRRVTFANDAGSPAIGSRTVEVLVTDGTGATSAPAYSTVTVASQPPSAAAPTITLSGGSALYIEGEESARLDVGLRVSDADSTTLASATIRISGGYVPGEDGIRFLPNPFYGNIQGSWNAATGTLTLTSAGATARLSEWNQALAQLAYTNSADEPTVATRTFSIMVNDGSNSSQIVTRTMTIQATNDAPIIDLNGMGEGLSTTIVYEEQAAPMAIAPSGVVSDVDSSDFAGGRLTVAYPQGYRERGSELDVLDVLHTGTGPGQIGVSNATISYGGVAIGTLTRGGGGTTPLIVELNGAATPAAVQAMLRAITYYNGSDTPPNPGPTLQVTLTDGDGGTSLLTYAYVSTRPIDDPLTVDLNGTAEGETNRVAYAPGAAPVAIAPEALLGDPDNTDERGGAANGSVRVRVLNPQAGDALGLLNQGNGPGQISLHEDNVVAYQGQAIGTVYPDTGQIVFNNGFVPLAAVQALVRAVYFANADANSSTIARMLEISVTLPGAAPVVRMLTVSMDGSRVLTGDRGDNELVGGRGNDTLDGRAGDDRLLGGEGNDTLIGGPGNDRLDGGAGVDTARISVSRSQATVTRNGDGTSSLAVGADGTDTASGVEQYQFSDGLYSFQFDQPGAVLVSNFGVGAGGWSSQNLYPRHIADMNGDGYSDIVGFGQAGVLVSFGSASGSFSGTGLVLANFGQASGWATDNQFHRELADVNGDGRADIVGFGYAGTLVSLAKADGTFTGPITGVANFGADQGWATQDGFARTTGDVNGDGKADLIGFGYAGTLVSLGNGDGTFQSVKLAIANFGVEQGWTNDNSFHRTVADVNGDGRDDLIGFGYAGTLVALAKADGTFDAPKLAVGNFGKDQGWSSQDSFARDAADVNGDTYADIVGFGIAGTFVAYGNANGTFSAASFDVSNFGSNQGWTSDNIYHRELADINNDGTIDIVGFGQAGVLAGYNQGHWLA
jgi:predicted cobalt transporter CbtA